MSVATIDQNLEATVTPWVYSVLPEVASTNTYVARKPEWTAIRAITQTAGRGRTPDRRWVSNAGGLWLSAVVPCPGPRTRWETLPLLAGAAVTDALGEFGVAHARLRWPNDVMVGHAKLAGLLVERYTAETAVVGIGMNVVNRPERQSPDLAGHVVSLSDLVPVNFEIDDVARAVLRSLRRAHAEFLESGFGAIASRLNRGWSDPRAVEVSLSGRNHSRLGLFLGVDDRGRLRVNFGAGPDAIYAPSEVSWLRELD